MRGVITALLLVAGTLLFVSAGIGLVRFPSAYSRLHAAGKATTLGLVCLVVAAFFQLTDLWQGAKLLLVVLFQVATVPISSHVMARAAHRLHSPLSTPDAVDEWPEDGAAD